MRWPMSPSPINPSLVLPGAKEFIFNLLERIRRRRTFRLRPSDTRPQSKPYVPPDRTSVKSEGRRRTEVVNCSGPHRGRESGLSGIWRSRHGHGLQFACVVPARGFATAFEHLDYNESVTGLDRLRATRQPQRK